MFYCEPCRLKEDWPTSWFRSRGTCEICGTVDACYDTPSSALPPAKPKLKHWQVAWRDGFLPNLPTEGLLRLRATLATDDRRLLQGVTCQPPPLQVTENWELEACDAIVWCFCVPGECKVWNASEAFHHSCFKANELLDKNKLGSRDFLNWYDEVPRKEMRRLLLQEVDRAIFNRLEIPLRLDTPPGIVADWLTERGRGDATHWLVDFKE